MNKETLYRTLSQAEVPAQQPSQQNEADSENDERKIREEHVLDVAAGLLMRWGYRKTTIDDVAREAGVGKGTIYLHWKSKNELFRAVIMREHKKVADEVIRRVTADPQGGLPHRQWAHTMLVALDNPLMAAIVKGQSDTFQGLLNSFDQKTFNQMLGDADSYIVQLQRAGLIRSDLSVSVITYLMTALKVGIIYATDIIDQEHMPSMEQLTEALSDLMGRWLSPEHLPGDTTEGKQALQEFLQNVQNIQDNK